MLANTTNPNWDMSNLVIDRNLINDSSYTSNYIARIGRTTSGAGTCPYYQHTASELNSCSNTWRGVSGVTNWDVDTAGLFLGSSGANRYKTLGSYVVSGATTVANGGIGGTHPYLPTVTLPSYIGATNPADIAAHDWVTGLINIAASPVATFTSITNGSTPTWIAAEDGGSETPTSVPTVGVGGFRTW
jgi:hypothetical protein